jgi:hypothetical protein
MNNSQASNDVIEHKVIYSIVSLVDTKPKYVQEQQCARRAKDNESGDE